MRPSALLLVTLAVIVGCEAEPQSLRVVGVRLQHAQGGDVKSVNAIPRTLVVEIDLTRPTGAVELWVERDGVVASKKHRDTTVVTGRNQVTMPMEDAFGSPLLAGDYRVELRASTAAGTPHGGDERAFHYPGPDRSPPGSSP